MSREAIHFFLPLDDDKLTALRQKLNVPEGTTNGTFVNHDVTLKWQLASSKLRVNSADDPGEDKDVSGVMIDVVEFHSMAANVAPQSTIINRIKSLVGA